MSFLRVSPQLYRGPQPRSDDLARLRAEGLKAVFNLREESTFSQGICREHGLVYHHIPIPDWTAPSHDQVAEFLELLAHESMNPALVHCWGGVGRTGVFACCYRIVNGMDAAEAIALSDRETPHLLMNQEQRRFVLGFTHRPIEPDRAGD